MQYFAAIRCAAFAVWIFSACIAHATPGRVDSGGCHGSKKWGYHCHPDRVSGGGSSENVRERERRLKRECKTAPGAGACAGYGYARK